jgi:hypothetical protein
VTSLRLIDDVLELDGEMVGRVLPGLRLSLRDRLTAAFDAADEAYVEQLEERIAQLEEWLKEPAQ